MASLHVTGSLLEGCDVLVVSVIDVLPSFKASPMYAVSGMKALTVSSAKYRTLMHVIEVGRSVADMRAVAVLKNEGKKKKTGTAPAGEP